MNKKILLLSATVLLVINSCNNSPVAPPEDQPGRRDYTWTVDTVNYPNSINRLWGSSPSDLWAVGPAGNLSKTIWHYDGEKWSTDGIFRLISATSIFGFSKYNVFIGTHGGQIWHFDENGWKEITALSKDGNSNIGFENIWGESLNNFYVFGAYPDDRGYFNNSVIAHYNSSNNWTMLSTDGLKGTVEHLYRNLYYDKIYIQAMDIGGGEYYDSTIIYEYYNGKYNKIYSSVWAKGLQSDISLINGEVYFILGNKIAKRVNNQFQTFLEVDNPNFYQRIWGRNSKDIFFSMTDGLVHYNGTDMKYLFRLERPSNYILQAALFENEVFFLVIDYPNNLNLIYHGKIEKGG